MPHAVMVTCLGALALTVHACDGLPKPIPAPSYGSQTAVREEGRQPATIVLGGMRDFAAEPPMFWAVGIGFRHDRRPDAVLLSVDAVEVRDVARQHPVAGFSFSANKATADGFGELESDTRWWGFHAAVRPPIPARVALVYFLTVSAGTDVEALRADLRLGFIGLSEAREDGTLVGNAHQRIERWADLLDRVAGEDGGGEKRHD